jgi:hypothetical protein
MVRPREFQKANTPVSIGAVKLVVTGPTYEITNSDQVLVVDDDAIGEQVTIFLPVAAESKDRKLIVKKFGETASVVVDGSGAETIDEAALQIITEQYDVIEMICDGTEWFIITNNTGLTAVVANTLDLAYDQGGAGVGRVITADTGAVQVDGSNQVAVDINQADNFGCLELDKNGAGAGVALKINNAGTGLDVEGESASWSVDSTGDGTFNRVSQAFQAVTAATSTTINFANGNHVRVAMNANITTLTLSNPRDGERYLLRLTQDATGSRTISWPAAVKWRGGAAPTLGGANVVDVVSMIYDSTGSDYLADAGNAFS